MDNHYRLDVFEQGDKTALVCMDVPEMERLVVDQLRDLGYKVHTGFSIDDLHFKMRAHIYDILVIAENIGATTIATNPLLNEAVYAPAAQRHHQLIVLVGASVKTADEMQAFQHSVDLVVSLPDAMNLRPMIKRAVSRAEEFYSRYFEALAAADVATN